MAVTENPLQMLEILITVLQYADNKTLVAATQVNSLWAEYATNTIWRGSGEGYGDCIADALLRLVDCCSDERLLWYTRKIRHLWIYLIEGNERFKSLFEQGKFECPNARSINIYIWDLDERHLARLLTPKIVALRLFSPNGPAILDEIKIRSPHLKLLMIRWQCDFTEDQFLDFLVHMPSITHLDGDDNHEALGGAKVLHHIARRPNLESLRIVESTIFEPIASGHTILPALRTLKVVLKQEHEKYLLPALRMLKDLRALFLDQFSECPPLTLEWISTSCPLLEEFIVCNGNLHVTGESLVLLARGCPLLRTLNLHIGQERDYTVTDECISEVTSMLPRLEFLRLSRRLPSLSIRSLIFFARNCPHLEVLDLPGIFELTSLLDESSNITFPFLQSLTIDHTKPAISSRRTAVKGARLERRRERLIAVLDARFPALEEFELSAGKNEFYDRVKNHLKETRAENIVKALPHTKVKLELERLLYDET